MPQSETDETKDETMNLVDLNNEQREDYKVKVSQAIGLDPALNLLDYFWIPQENGFNSLVLYAKRGAAEILREKHSVNITSLVREDGPGFVCFTAQGTNKTGRTEIAIGSSSIDGLRGEKLASSVMAASTRALRRLTMQFAGCGVLDESEVYGLPAQNAPQAAANAQLAGSGVVMPPPQVAPNTEVGKDITPEPGSSEQIAKVYAEGKAFLETTPISSFDAGGPPNVHPNPPKEGDSLQSPAEEPRKRRGRKPRNSKDISSPGQESVAVQTEMPVGHIDAQGIISPTEPVSAVVETAPKTEILQMPPLPIAAIQMVNEMVKAAEVLSGVVTIPQPVSATPPAQQPAKVELSEAQKAAYLSKWRDYTQNILPIQGKMMPSDGIGRSTM